VCPQVRRRIGASAAAVAAAYVDGCAPVAVSAGVASVATASAASRSGTGGGKVQMLLSPQQQSSSTLQTRYHDAAGRTQ